MSFIKRLFSKKKSDFHIPNGLLLEMEGKNQLRYITYLSIDSSEIITEHIATILDSHAENWVTTNFSGDVNFQFWNDLLEDEHLEPVGQYLGEVIAQSQKLIDDNGIASADGNRVVLRYTLSKHHGDATEQP
ncbi:hypothetical protein NT6N_04070 [Oceaniferula spumae]|uniref:Uncharacterized protein n=1 Tax=Oceaniferula spumae TaxID=2979115 RepID=A0AAT9FHC1_9BACT